MRTHWKGFVTCDGIADNHYINVYTIAFKFYGNNTTSEF